MHLFLLLPCTTHSLRSLTFADFLSTSKDSDLIWVLPIELLHVGLRTADRFLNLLAIRGAKTTRRSQQGLRGVVANELHH